MVRLLQSAFHLFLAIWGVGASYNAIIAPRAASTTSKSTSTTSKVTSIASKSTSTASKVTSATSGAASTASSCSLYTVQSSDTCLSIGKTTNATYAQLLSWNPNINALCSNLNNLTDNKICISNPLGNYALSTNLNGQSSYATTAASIPTPTMTETNSLCGEYYLVVLGDDCSKIGEEFNIPLDNFLFLNPDVWTNCTNLQPDYYYCIEPVGDISTYPGFAPTPTTEPFVKTPTTQLPYLANPFANFTTGSQPVIPLANATRLDCSEYIWFDNLTDNAASDCWSLAQVYGVTGEDFILWNPSLAEGNSTTTATSWEASTTTASTTNSYAYPCTLSANTSYCVALATATTNTTSTSTPTITPPSPRAAGEIANCTTWFQPQNYSTCQGIITVFWLTMDEFYDMNPSVNSDCSGMVVGTYYCISTYPGGTPPAEPDDYSNSTSSSTSTSSRITSSAHSTSSTVSTPSPIQSGMVSNCNAFYAVVGGDTCSGIAQTYNIALSTFYAWNPAVGTSCGGLQAKVYVCVGVSASSSSSSTKATATPTTTKATSSGVSTPSPVQSGMVSDCTAFYFVQKGDGCYNIASAEDISLDNFYAWNPAVGTSCGGLQASTYVCVAVAVTSSVQVTTPSPTTTKPSTTASGIVTPTPTQSGMVGDCDSFYYVQNGDGCYNIATAENISLDNFYAWNPAVKTDCSGLQAYTYVCIGVE